ncbi:MAG: acyltransferase [Phycisphaerae bacterium]|nr:acyltransferase [Phycisphaerae bacterium]
MPTEPKRYEFIDALRGVAILAVIAGHTAFIASPSPRVQSVLTQGARGVQLFYVISAFTLFASMSARSRNERRPVLNYFLRRFFRIAPLFYVAAVICLVIWGWGPRYHAPYGVSAQHVVATFAFLHGWHPHTINSVVEGGWSIGIEMSFYLLLPYCFRRIRTLRGAVAATLVALVAGRMLTKGLNHVGPALFAPDHYHLVRYFSFMWLPSQIPLFMMGFILYFLIHSARAPHAPAIDAGVRDRGSIIYLAAALYVMLALTFPDRNLLPPHVLFGATFVAMAYALSRWPVRWLVNPLTCYFGKVSYSAYLMHFFVIRVMQGLFRSASLEGPGPAQYLLALYLVLVCTALVSTFTYHVIEQPGQRLGRLLIDRLDARPDRARAAEARAPLSQAA